MYDRKNKQIMVAVFIVYAIIVSSCSTVLPQSNEQAMSEALIDATYFKSLPLCTQLWIYASINPTHVDRDHIVKLMPAWVDNAIDSHSMNSIADCISEEGFRRLSLLERMPDKRKEISLSIHALIYKAYNLDLLGYPQIQKLLDEVVCRSDVMYANDLGTIYYFDKLGIPDFLGEQNTSERMVEELCSR